MQIDVARPFWRITFWSLRVMKLRIFLLVLGIASGGIFMLGSGSAAAEGRCPPGYFPIGGGGSGWEGCAPMGGDGEDGPRRSQPQ